MDLTPYVESLRRSLTTAASAGDDRTLETAGLLADALEPAVRLAVLDALAVMAAEVTTALDGDAVEIRLRGRDPEVVVTRAVHPEAEIAPPADDLGDDGGTARISLRLPDALKARAEAAAGVTGASLNTWLVRAVSAALREPSRPDRASGRGPHRYTGFARS